jgi:hypothetical protein
LHIKKNIGPLIASFARAVNHAAEDELEEDLLQQVMATTLEEEVSPPCLDDVADYFSLAEEEAEFQDLEQEVNPETSPVELKQLPPRLQYVFLNGDRKTPVIISDKLFNDETRKLVAEGPEKASREGVNGSQSKFLCKNWPMS